jgi:hypothetical protein
MVRPFRLIWFVSAITFTLANLFAAAPATAHPAVITSCYGASCNGLDPDAAGCSIDAYPVASTTKLERYYSPSCNTFYAVAAGSDSYPSVYAWMDENFNVTARYGGYVVSAMWERGLACVYGYGHYYDYSTCI